MKLGTRLIFSFLLMVLLPIFLAGAVYLTVNHNRITKGKTAGQFYFSNNVDDLVSYTDDEVRTLEELARTFPDYFLNSDSQKQANDNLTKKNSYLVIRVGTKIVYDGASAGVHPQYNKLPMYGKLSNGDMLIIDLQTETGILKEIDFGKEDGKRGQAFVITPAGSIVRGGESVALYYVSWFVVIMIITGLVTSFLLYRSIMRKVSLMQAATEKIREGDLESRIEVRGRDELSQLAESMERMRSRLLSDATQKVADEDSNRKFLSNITHDLKTPLTSIIGYSEGILDGIAADPERQKKYVGIIHSKAVDMNELLNELSEFSKLDMHEIPYHFEKIDARLSAALFSVGAVKAVEIGDGIKSSFYAGSENNDGMTNLFGDISKTSNHAGGCLGGMTDGSMLVARAYFKPTPSIAQTQLTVDKNGNDVSINIKGRHDPVIVPRAVVVTEAMADLVLADLLMQNAVSRLDNLKKIYTEQGE